MKHILSTPGVDDSTYNGIMTGTEQTLRRRRVYQGRHRRWEIIPRYGTGPDDRWTVIGSPIPGASNPARVYEDGQYPTIAVAKKALTMCRNVDDGTHEED
jgi:hypothetical protein